MSDVSLENLSESEAAMRSYLQRIATGPELSKDISLQEARHGMQLILDGRADSVQAGVFLIALRMKRESDDEVRGILEAIRETGLAPLRQILQHTPPAVMGPGTRGLGDVADQGHAAVEGATLEHPELHR